MTASAENFTDVHFELQTSRVTPDDGCMRWLTSRYAHVDGGSSVTRVSRTSANTDAMLTSLVNDINACATHRWAHFSYHSPVYGAAREWRNSGSSNSTEVRIVTNREASTDAGGDLTVTLHDSSHVADPRREVNEALLVEPSRHIVTALLYKRKQESIVKRVEAAAEGHRISLRSTRPFFGGYFTLSSASSFTRFMIFPQRKHAPASLQLQEIPYLVRGSIEHKPKSPQSGKLKRTKGWLSPLLKEVILNASFLCKFARSAPRFPLFDYFDAIRLDMYLNNRNSETLYLQSRSKNKKKHVATSDSLPAEKNAKENAEKTKAKLTTVKFRDGGLRAQLFSRDPRHSILLNIGRRVTHQPKSDKQAIHSIVITEEFNSAVQRFTTTLLQRWLPHAKYSLRWMVGPGVEFLAGEVPLTIFGKLKTEWWVDLPIFVNRVLLRLRNQSALVQPLNFYSQVQPENAKHHRKKKNVAHDSSVRTHNLFWATQGPQWDASLVRGFQNDHKSMHYASRWYSLWSAELVLNKSQEHQGKKVHKSTRAWPTGMLYANACFVDSWSLSPRASVGFSLSGVPRRTVDAFNVINPFSFECSFNWLLNFTQESVSLVSGVVEGEAADKALVRVSPAETFRHFRCGLTWSA